MRLAATLYAKTVIQMEKTQNARLMKRFRCAL